MDRLKQNVELGQSMAEDYVEGELDMDARGQTASAMAVVSLVVALTVGALIAAFLIPIGVEEISSVNTSEDWSGGAASLWGILDVMIVLAVFLFFTGIALAATNRV